jgi:hypothetical protein
MTTRGKLVLTILLLGVVGLGIYRWWDKVAPQSRPQNQSIDVARVKQQIDEAKKAAYGHSIIDRYQRCHSGGKVRHSGRDFDERLQERHEGRKTHRSISHQCLARLDAYHPR